MAIKRNLEVEAEFVGTCNINTKRAKTIREHSANKVKSFIIQLFQFDPILGDITLSWGDDKNYPLRIASDADRVHGILHSEEIHTMKLEFTIEKDSDYKKVLSKYVANLRSVHPDIHQDVLIRNVIKHSTLEDDLVTLELLLFDSEQEWEFVI
jgi:hypothetical protein